MQTEPKEVSGFSGQLKYVDSCPNQPVPTKAFCQKHCDEAALLKIPINLTDYVSSKNGIRI